MFRYGLGQESREADVRVARSEIHDRASAQVANAASALDGPGFLLGHYFGDFADTQHHAPVVDAVQLVVFFHGRFGDRLVRYHT